MVIACPECNTHFKLNGSRIHPDGSKVRCSKCSHIFKVIPGQRSEGGRAPIEKEIEGLLENFKKALYEVLDAGKQAEEFRRKAQISETQSCQSDQNLSSDQLSSSLSHLAVLLKQNDMEAEECLKNLKNMIITPANAQLVAKIEEYINQLDFECAYSRLTELANSLNIVITGEENDGQIP